VAENGTTGGAVYRAGSRSSEGGDRLDRRRDCLTRAHTNLVGGAAGHAARVARRMVEMLRELNSAFPDQWRYCFNDCMGGSIGDVSELGGRPVGWIPRTAVQMHGA
jgi:hypothetical protein